MIIAPVRLWVSGMKAEGNGAEFRSGPGMWCYLARMRKKWGGVLVAGITDGQGKRYRFR
jgi:hypothetical protein